MGGDDEEKGGEAQEGACVRLGSLLPSLQQAGEGRRGDAPRREVRPDQCGIELVEAVAKGVTVDELAQDKVSILQEIVLFTGVLNLEGFTCLGFYISFEGDIGLYKAKGKILFFKLFFELKKTCERMFQADLKDPIMILESNGF